MPRRFCVPFLALALSACGAPETASVPAAGSALRLTTYDALATPGHAVSVRVKVERDGTGHPDVRGVPVQISVGGRDAGTVTSGDDGYAEVALTAANARGDLTVEARAAAASDATGRVYVRPADEAVLVTDIDGTISDLDDLRVLVTPNERIPAVAGSVAALAALSRRHTILYLTARDDAMMAKTRDWLALRAFPAGPLLVADWGPDFSQARYKRESLARVHSVWPEASVGVGNATHDAEAYLVNGMRAYMIGNARVEGAENATWDHIASVE